MSACDGWFCFSNEVRILRVENERQNFLDDLQQHARELSELSGVTVVAPDVLTESRLNKFVDDARNALVRIPGIDEMSFYTNFVECGKALCRASDCTEAAKSRRPGYPEASVHSEVLHEL